MLKKLLILSALISSSASLSFAQSFGENGVRPDASLTELTTMDQSKLFSAYVGDISSIGKDLVEIKNSDEHSLGRTLIAAYADGEGKEILDKIDALNKKSLSYISCASEVFEANMNAVKERKPPQIFFVIRQHLTVNPNADYKTIFNNSFLSCNAWGMADFPSQYQRSLMRIDEEIQVFLQERE